MLEYLPIQLTSKPFPIPGYYFNVGFIFQASQKMLPVDIGFKEISGMSADLNLEDRNQLGVNGYRVGLPNKTKFSNLVLKKGLVKNSTQLMKWFEESRVSMVVKTATVVLSILDEETHRLLVNYMFFNAFPVKWEVSGFNAMESQLLIETVELKYDYFQRLY